MVSRIQASPGHRTGVVHEAPTWSATTAIAGSEGCLSGTSAIATPYLSVPDRHRDTIPIPNVRMSSRSFIFSNIYRGGSEIMEQQHPGFSRHRHRERTSFIYYVTYRHQLKLRLWRENLMFLQTIFLKKISKHFFDLTELGELLVRVETSECLRFVVLVRVPISCCETKGFPPALPHLATTDATKLA